MERDARIDVYIAQAAPFAQPILAQVRRCMALALPEAAETIKWSMPFFLLGARPFANMAAFKAHAAFGFWKGPQTGKESEAMGQYGRLTSVEELPPETEFIAMIQRQAAAEPAPPRPKPAPKPAITAPADFTAALAANPAARAGFDALSQGARREYLEWIIAAKRDATRAERIEKAIAQCAEGKKLNWKYENC